MSVGRFTLRQIKAMPVVSHGQFDNLVFDDGKYRVWVSRMTRDDGAPYDNQVTVDRHDHGRWKQIDSYNPALVGTGAYANEATSWVNLTYGELPSLADFELRLRDAKDEENARLVGDPPDVLPMVLVDDNEIAAVKRAAAAIGSDVSTGPDVEYPWKTAVQVRTIKALYKLLQSLARQWQQGDEGAGSLASSIMYVLRYEWI